MITLDELNRLATHFQVTQFNVAREYCQHIFLSRLYQLDGSEKILFKGGTALRIVYGSPRFSEDLDFSSFNIEPRNFKRIIEDKFQDILKFMESIGMQVDLDPKSNRTSGGYWGKALFKLHDLKVGVEINVSRRDSEKPIRGDVEAVPNEFIPQYNLYHLPVNLLVEEKINALFSRDKARDLYDLYFMLRKGMVTTAHKEKLKEAAEKVAQASIDVGGELRTLLPINQQDILKNLKAVLLKELERNLSTS